MCTILGNPITVGGYGRNVIVSVASGAVVTAKKGNKTVTAISIGGTAKLSLTKGTWSISAVTPDGYYSKAQTVTIPIPVDMSTLYPPEIVLFDGKISTEVNPALTLVSPLPPASSEQGGNEARVIGSVPKAYIALTFYKGFEVATLPYAGFQIDDHDLLVIGNDYEFSEKPGTGPDTDLAVIFSDGSETLVTIPYSERKTVSLFGKTGLVKICPQYNPPKGPGVETITYIKLSNK